MEKERKRGKKGEDKKREREREINVVFFQSQKEIRCYPFKMPFLKNSFLPSFDFLTSYRIIPGGKKKD